MAETATVLAAFLVAGAVFQGVARAHHERARRADSLADPRAAPYPRAMDSAEAPESGECIWLLDGFNVLHAALGGRDRNEWWCGERRAELLALVAQFRAPAGAVPASEGSNRPDGVAESIWVVFDGPHPAVETADDERLRVVFAPSADAWLVARVKSDPAPARLAVVTADRRLAGRVRHRGAQVVPPREFLAHCAPGSARESSSVVAAPHRE